LGVDIGDEISYNEIARLRVEKLGKCVAKIEKSISAMLFYFVYKQ
jgi:hypothetical protein